MFMSGVEVPPLGSTKDRTLRKFMTLESKRKLKSEELTLSIALLSCDSPENVKKLKDVFSTLMELEHGVSDTLLEEKNVQQEEWQQYYEQMQQMDVRIGRSDGGLVVQGL